MRQNTKIHKTKCKRNLSHVPGFIQYKNIWEAGVEDRENLESKISWEIAKILGSTSDFQGWALSQDS